jgi:uncharacterized surface protein with fasciclin (FAS1) repeats
MAPMKKLIVTGTACGTLLFFLGFISCKKTAAPEKVPITPLQTLINTDTTLTLYHRMLLQANDAALLADDSVTLLLLSNDVLRSAGYSEIIIDSLSAFFLDNLLRYQYINSRVEPDSGAYTAYPTLLGVNLFVMRDSARHTLFNATPSTGNPDTVGRALVYRLSALLPPAVDSLPVLIQGDSTLSFLAEVFLRTNVYDSLLQTGSFTLLAPVNSAFQQAGYDSLGAIDSANVNSLIQLLEYQIVPGPYFTNTLTGLTSLPTLQGGSVMISAAGGLLRFSGNSNPVPANLITGNQVAGNSIVVYRIDQVLSP